MPFHVLPERTGSAAENMADDFLLLQRYTQPGAIRFRHYGWRRPACTFGFSQKITFVRTQLPEDGLDLCRRPTGGGLVDHREDWTYALVVPRAHAWWAQPAPAVYREIHEALRESLDALGGGVVRQEKAPLAPPGVCFVRAEIDDLVKPETGQKVAGAAMKRNKNGLLVQGSIWRPLLPAVRWDDLRDLFARRLGQRLAAVPGETRWPDWDADEEAALIDQYASEAWVDLR